MIFRNCWTLFIEFILYLFDVDVVNEMFLYFGVFSYWKIWSFHNHSNFGNIIKGIIIIIIIIFFDIFNKIDLYRSPSFICSFWIDFSIYSVRAIVLRDEWFESSMVYSISCMRFLDSYSIIYIFGLIFFWWSLEFPKIFGVISPWGMLLQLFWEVHSLQNHWILIILLIFVKLI